MPNYKLPKSIEAYTLHKREASSPKTVSVEQYVNSHGFCLTTDLLNYGFKPQDIEAAVNGGQIGVALWPEKNSVTDLYFSKDTTKLGSLEQLARRVAKYCNTNTSFSQIFSFFGNNSCVVAGLAYARDKGKLQETENPNQENNPRYSSSVKRDNSSKSVLMIPCLISSLFSPSGSYNLNPASFLNEGNIKERWKKRKKK